MTYVIAVYLLAVVAFSLSCYYSRVTTSLGKSLKVIHSVKAVMMDKEIADIEKEKSVQRSALIMLRLSLIIVIQFLLIILATFSPAFIAEVLGIATLAEVANFALRLEVLIVTTVILVAAVRIFGKRKRGEMSRNSHG